MADGHRPTGQHHGGEVREESRQWRYFQDARHRVYEDHFGYRLIEAMRNLAQLREPPRLLQTLGCRPYTCDRCVKEHVEFDLSLALPIEWLLKSGACPRLLRDYLTSATAAHFDLRVSVTDALLGFEDVLFGFLLAEDCADGLATVLIDTADQSAQHICPEVRGTHPLPGQRNRSVEMRREGRGAFAHRPTVDPHHGALHAKSGHATFPLGTPQIHGSSTSSSATEPDLPAAGRGPTRPMLGAAPAPRA